MYMSFVIYQHRDEQNARARGDVSRVFPEICTLTGNKRHRNTAWTRAIAIIGAPSSLLSVLKTS